MTTGRINQVRIAKRAKATAARRHQYVIKHTTGTWEVVNSTGYRKERNESRRTELRAANQRSAKLELVVCSTVNATTQRVT